MVSLVSMQDNGSSNRHLLRWANAGGPTLLPAVDLLLGGAASPLRVAITIFNCSFLDIPAQTHSECVPWVIPVPSG